MTIDTMALLAEARRLLGPAPARAAALARIVVEQAPAAVEPRFILAAALRRSDDLTGSLAVIAPLAATMPVAWGVQYEHGMALAGLGRAEQAAAALTSATSANPASSLAWHALGDQLALLGRMAEATRAQAQEVPGWAGDPALLAAVATMLDGRGDLARFGMHLSDLAVVRLVADVAMRLGRFDETAALLGAIPARAPLFLPARQALALALFRLDRAEAALTEIEKVFATRPVAAVRRLRAAILMQSGDAVRAIDDYAVVVATEPDAHAWHAYGHALRAAGRLDATIDAYLRAIALRPAFGEAWWSLADLKTWRFAPTHREQMVAVLDAGVEGDDRIYLDFALGKALEDERSFAAAFDHYDRGNAARRRQLPHDAEGARGFVARTIATLTPAFLASRPSATISAPGPIFVVGMPRSGSTLVEQILASHSEVEGASELPDITALARRVAERGKYPEVLGTLDVTDRAALGDEYLARTRIRRPLRRPYFVDKFPGNVLHIGLIHLILPHATIIDVRRDPLACCWSLYKQVFAAGQAYSYDLADLGHAYRDYVELTAHLDRVMPGRILRLSYEALVDEPEREIRRLLDHVGLAFEPACLRFFETDRVVRTPSSEQVRRPIFRDGLDQWRNFEPWLGSLKAALARP